MISGLYAVSNLDLLINNSGLSLKKAVRLILAGGVKTLQLREPMLSLREFYEIALFAVEAAHELEAKLLINDRVDLMLAAGADGVHLGWRSLPLKIVRKLVGPEKIIGVSAHSLRECLEAEAAGASYVTLGPVYATPSKYGILDPLGLEVVREVVSKSKVPIVAIGGISPDRVAEVLECGVSGIAVMSGIMGADDVKAAAISFSSRLTHN